MGGNVLTPLDLREPHLVRAVTYFASAGKIKTLVLVVLLVAAISISDSRIEPSLGVFYIVPMVLAALALGPLEIVILAGVCAVLRLLFDYPGSATEAVLRFLLAAVAYTVTGLFVTVLVRNREVAIAHLAQIQKEQELRKV